MTSVGNNGFDVAPESVKDEGAKIKGMESKHQKLAEKINNISDAQQLHKICEEIKASPDFKEYKESYDEEVSKPAFKAMVGSLKDDAKTIELLFDLALIHTVSNVDVGALNRVIEVLAKGVRGGNEGPRAKL